MLLEERIDEGVRRAWVLQVRGGAGEIEFLVRSARRSPSTNLPRKTRLKHLHRQEEERTSADPVLYDRAKPAGRNHAVYMGMEEQFCPQVCRMLMNADLARPRRLRIGRDLEHGGGARAGRAGRTESGRCDRQSGIELMRQSEDDVEVRHVEEFLFPRREPALASLRLALRAVPVAAGVIRDGLMAACEQ